MRIIVLITLALSCLPSFSKDRVNERSCQIIYLGDYENVPKKVHLFDGTISRKVTLPNRNLSEEIRLLQGDLLLGLALAPVMRAEDFPKGAPTLEIPEEVTEFYLIVVSDPENKILPIKMLYVDVSDHLLELGQTLWVNLTEHAIKANLGDKDTTIPPDARVISEAPLPKSGYYLAEFLYQPEGKGEFLPVMKKSWWLDAKSKNLGIIQKTSQRLPKIFSVRDK